MGALHEYGTVLAVGGQNVIHGTAVTFTNYICKKTGDGSYDVKDEEVEDQDGKLCTIEIYDLHKNVTLNLICKSAATPLADFPDKQMCTIASLTDWRVQSVNIDKTRSPNEVQVTLRKLNFA
jgi:hypothetical protein